MPISHRHPITPWTTFFPNINLTKAIKNLLGFWKSLKNGSNNLCFHPYVSDWSERSFPYQRSFSRRGPVNPSIPNFNNINLTKTITNLIIVGKFNGCKNLYFQEFVIPKSFNIIFKSNSYLITISCRGPVTPLKTIKNLLIVSKITKKWL